MGSPRDNKTEMRHGALVLSVASILTFALACGSSSSTDAADSAPPAGISEGGSAPLSMGGHGGSAAGHGGQAGTTSQVGGNGGVGPGGASSGGFAGASAAGAAGASGPTCPPAHVSTVAACASATDACAACVCADVDCGAAWDACVVDPGCSKALQCLEKTCPSALCAELAGAGETKLVALLGCSGATCATSCGFAGASSGTGGAGGASSGHGGAGGLASGGAAGSGGITMAAGTSGAGTGGSAGGGGQGGTTAIGGAGGEPSNGGAGGASSGYAIACDPSATSPSMGACAPVDVSGPVSCNPITGAPCMDPYACVQTFDADMPSGFACATPTGQIAVCGTCGAKTPCTTGAACVDGGTCAKVCCNDDDCGAPSFCDLGGDVFGLGVCRSP